MTASREAAGPASGRPTRPRRRRPRAPLALRPTELVPLTGPQHTAAVRALADLLSATAPPHPAEWGTSEAAEPAGPVATLPADDGVRRSRHPEDGPAWAATDWRHAG
ncbi:MAG: hypothetical protein ACYCU5_00030 [Actinomycetes bacterium]